MPMAEFQELTASQQEIVLKFVGHVKSQDKGSCHVPVQSRDLGAPSGGCGCGLLVDIILMLGCSRWAPRAADGARGTAWRSDSALYCIHSTPTFKRKRVSIPKHFRVMCVTVMYVCQVLTTC